MATRKKTKPNEPDAIESYVIELDFLDPAGFPDLAAVCAFFEGDSLTPGESFSDYTAMTIAVQDALDPHHSVPDDVVSIARDAAYWLVDDLETLTKALVRGAPVEAVHGPNWFAQGRAQLLALTLAENGDGWHPDIATALYRWLVDPVVRGPLSRPDRGMRPEQRAQRARAIAANRPEVSA